MNQPSYNFRDFTRTPKLPFFFPLLRVLCGLLFEFQFFFTEGHKGHEGTPSPIFRWQEFEVQSAATINLQMVYNLIFPRDPDRGYTPRGMCSGMDFRAGGRREWSRDYVVVVENHFFEPLHQHAP